MKMIEFNLRIVKIMKILELQTRIMKIIRILKFHAGIHKNNENITIPKKIIKKIMKQILQFHKIIIKIMKIKLDNVVVSYVRFREFENVLLALEFSFIHTELKFSFGVF
jgi:hypothetical protein